MKKGDIRNMKKLSLVAGLVAVSALLGGTVIAIQQFGDNPLKPASAKPANQISASRSFSNEIVGIAQAFTPADAPHYFCDQGQTYLTDKKYAEAIESFNKALEAETKPQHRADILCDLGLSYSATGDKTRARTSLEEAARLYESLTAKSDAVLFRLADVYSATGNPEASEKIYRQLIRESSSTDCKSNAKKLLVSLPVQPGRSDEFNAESNKNK
jgi:tetratricopeptide (TPR) repeat protein